MFKLKSLTGVVLVLTVLFAQVGTVFAAPAAQETTDIVGIVQTVTVEEGVNGGEPTVLVTLVTNNVTQTVRISVDTAAGLGLLELDLTTNEPVLDLVTGLPVVADSYPPEVSIDPILVIVDEEETDEAVNPVAAILASFFGVDASVVNQYHEDGFGFGVIAQALWIAKGLEENNPGIDAGMILQAKQDQDFSAFVLPDGSTPTNWGQFKNAATGKDKKNLGIIVSGHAENEDDTTGINSQGNPGNGRDKNKDKENGKDKNKKP